MKGCVVSDGYMGWIRGRYVLFSTEQEYIEAYREFGGDEYDIS